LKVRIATWNVNSVRLRLDAIAQLVKQWDVDVLCFQETKVIDDAFPIKAFRRLGFDHCALNGQKSYNGVAILSRRAFERRAEPAWCGKRDCRHIWITLDIGIDVHNFYVPAGGDIPDPEQNEKFAHKLQFLSEMTDWFGKRRRRNPKSVLVGDLNIAPHENDVWSHKQLLKVVSHTPVEVEALTRLYQTRDWVDAVRHFVPHSEKLYSWWSYRSPRWQDSDRGRRLDHIWTTPALKSHLSHLEVLRDMRGWEKPSDHVPIVVELNLPKG